MKYKNLIPMVAAIIGLAGCSQSDQTSSGGQTNAPMASTVVQPPANTPEPPASSPSATVAATPAPLPPTEAAPPTPIPPAPAVPATPAPPEITNNPAPSNAPPAPPGTNSESSMAPTNSGTAEKL